MAVTITDNRQELDQADATTNFNQGSQNTTDFAESTASISLAINIGTDQLFWAGAAVDFTVDGDESIYIWSSNTATQNGWNEATQADSSHAIWLSDSTPNEIVLLNAGNDRITFQHSDGQVQFQSFLIDVDYIATKDAAGEVFAVSGSVASFDATDVIQVGAYYVTTSKALAGGFNAFIDIIRYGNDGITISGENGTFEELAAADRSTANQAAHGILREYTVGSFGCQGTITFGSTGATTTSFIDSGISVTFENRDVLDDKWTLSTLSDTDSTNTLDLSDSLFSSAGPGVTVDFSGDFFNTLTLNTVTFRDLINPIFFPTDSASFSHDVTNCTFTNCGQVDPGTVTMSNCTFSTADSYGDKGAFLLDSDGTANLSSLTFIFVTEGHGIHITATGTYTFTGGYTFTGFGANETTDAAVFNDSGGAVTINVPSGDSPTVRNSPGSTTNIVASKTIDFHAEDSDGNNLAYAQVYIQKATPTAQFAGAGNSAGNGTLDVSSAIDADIPTGGGGVHGWVIVYDKSENATQPYRFVSVSGSTLTFPTTVSGTANAGSDATTIVDTSGQFTGVQEGDTIRNTTDTGAWAVVDHITGRVAATATSIITSPLRGGALNTWADGDVWSVNDLATGLVENVDTVDIPLANKQTDDGTTGDIPQISFNLGADIPVVIRVRSNEGATKYIPFVTAATINDNFSGTAVVQEDPVAT